LVKKKKKKSIRDQVGKIRIFDEKIHVSCEKVKKFRFFVVFSITFTQEKKFRNFPGAQQT